MLEGFQNCLGSCLGLLPSSWRQSKLKGWVFEAGHVPTVSMLVNLEPSQDSHSLCCESRPMILQAGVLRLTIVKFVATPTRLEVRVASQQSK